MAFIPSGSSGLFSDTGTVQIVPAPSGTSRRIVTSFSVFNPHTAASPAVDVRIKQGTSRHTFYYGTIGEFGTKPWGTDMRVVLHGDDRSVTGILAGTVAVQPIWIVSWGDDNDL